MKKQTFKHASDDELFEAQKSDENTGTIDGYRYAEKVRNAITVLSVQSDYLDHIAFLEALKHEIFRVRVEGKGCPQCLQIRIMSVLTHITLKPITTLMSTTDMLKNEDDPKNRCERHKEQSHPS